jgi:hypothetical protein
MLAENKMTVIKFPSRQPRPPFFKEVMEEGYHIFSLKNAKIQGYYPNKFPDYPGVNMKELRVDDIITVRAFFALGNSDNVRVDGGYLDLQVERIEDHSVFAEIQTELPPDFPIETGDTIEVYEEEILYKATSMEH